MTFTRAIFVCCAALLVVLPARADQATTPAPAAAAAEQKPVSFADQNKAAGAAYAAAVAKKFGVKPQADGLIFISKTEGTGDHPTKTDAVSVDYEGRLIDGTLFDSSYRTGKPIMFPLDHVIACWQEALQLMRPGGRARILCPSSIAYGDAGQPPDIPPGALLDFTVELHGIVQ